MSDVVEKELSMSPSAVRSREKREREREARGTNSESATATEPSQGQIDAYLKANGLVAVAVPVADRPSMRTLREAVALPEEDDPDVVTMVADPRYDYVLVQADDHAAFQGHNERDPAYYRELGFRRVPVVKNDDQDLILRYLPKTHAHVPDGARVKVRPGQIIMARVVEIGRREREAELRKNDPKRDSPEDVHMQNARGGHFYEEDRPIKGRDLGEALPDRSNAADVARSRERVEDDPDARRVLDRMERDAANLTDD